jgi:hypothetical protein
MLPSVVPSAIVCKKKEPQFFCGRCDAPASGIGARDAKWFGQSAH